MKFGLLGYPLSHSFSATYFQRKFQQKNLPYTYENISIPELNSFFQNKEYQAFQGLNVTIPYKEQIIPHLHQLDPIAEKIGAVNVIAVQKGKCLGYNTDYIGFQQSLLTKIKPHHQRALVLGTGGSSKAIQYALKDLKIPFLLVSRQPKLSELNYVQIDQNLLKTHQIIIHCTPLGMFPKVEDYPAIPYEYLNEQHLLFDLIYNPAETLFLQKGRLAGAQTMNGLRMLEIQAEESWKIWTSL